MHMMLHSWLIMNGHCIMQLTLFTGGLMLLLVMLLLCPPAALLSEFSKAEMQLSTLLGECR
jgi:hypothetical protein